MGTHPGEHVGFGQDSQGEGERGGWDVELTFQFQPLLDGAQILLGEAPMPVATPGR